jgi:hypothetical protein
MKNWKKNLDVIQNLRKFVKAVKAKGKKLNPHHQWPVRPPLSVLGKVVLSGRGGGKVEPYVQGFFEFWPSRRHLPLPFAYATEWAPPLSLGLLLLYGARN